MAAAAVPLMIASTAMAAYGAVRQGQAASAAADYNSKVADQNAEAAQAQGQAQAQEQYRQAQQRIGASIAAFGGSGVQGTSGSATDVLASNIQSATLDNLTTQYNSKIKALGFVDQSSLDQADASNASTAGYLNATGDVLKGASSAAYMNSGGGGAAGGSAGGGTNSYGIPLPAYLTSRGISQ